MAKPESAPSEPAYVFGTDLAGKHDTDSANVAVSLHHAETGKGSGASGDSYAIPYRNSNGELLPPDVIRNYVESFFHYARDEPHTRFQIARFACEPGAHGDETMARLFKQKPANCILPGLWLRVLNPDQAARLLLFDPGAHLKDAVWQAHLQRYLDLNLPLWGAPTVKLVSVGQSRIIVANDTAAKKLGLMHRVIGLNEAYYGRDALFAAETNAVWYATHLLSVIDFDQTAQPQQIRVMNTARRGGLQVEQLDADLSA